MALSGAALYELRNAGSSRSGGGFNPTNANMLTDLAATSATGNAPVVTSATYTFQATDQGSWVYVSAGTNWTPGFYKIDSVTGGAATLFAAVGEAVQFNATQQRWRPSTVAGCATTGSPTGGTFSVDYSQVDTEPVDFTADLVSTASTTVTSVTSTFHPAMVGNYLHLISATGADEAVGWYEIVSFTNATTLVLDRVSGTYTVGDFVIGGSLDLSSVLADEITEIMLAGNQIFVKAGTDLALGEAVSTTADGGTQNPIRMLGYGTVRGDDPTGTNRPTIAFAANTWASGDNWDYENIIFTATGAAILTLGANGKAINCKFMNSGTSGTNFAIQSGTDGLIAFCECISYRGRAINCGAAGSGVIYGCYIHDSDIGFRQTQSTRYEILFCIISDCVTAAVQLTAANAVQVLIANNTLYGCEDTLGIGVSIATGTTDIRVLNNIIYGFVTGIDHADTQSVSFDNWNDYFNNDADVSAATEWQKGPNDLALDPDFTNVAQLSGATATTVTSVLTQSGADFSTVTNGVDFCHIRGGTGVTAGKYRIITHTTDTLTLDPAPGTNATADKVWRVTTGHDFSVGTALKAMGSPGAFPAALTTGYLDIGAAQRQEQASGGGGGLRVIGG